MVSFFLKHPVIAIVLNAMLLVVGYLSLQQLPLCEYPQVKIPEFTIQTKYQNGDASYMEQVVTSPIEDKIMNLEGIEKIQSETSQGNSVIEVVFKIGTNIDAAQMGLREAIAQAGLPREIPQSFIVRRGSKDNGVPFFLILVESKTTSPQDLTHYTNCLLRHSFRGIDGVAEVNVLGSPYKMDIVLDGKRMRHYGISASIVFEELDRVLRKQPLGKFHDLYPLRLDQPLSDPKDFQKIMIPASKKFAVALGDFSAINLVKNDGEFRFHVNGKSGVGLEIKDASTANPLDVSNQLHTKIAELRKILPGDISLKVIIDLAEFIRSSLNQVRNSLIEAIVCVMLVVGLFLGSLRLSFVPLVTIPLSLMGSMVVLKAFGYSINTLTLLGAVLATGLVVDDAIVVLENVSRYNEKLKNPFQAALLGTQEIAFAVIAMTLTLASVYLPVIFQKDALGQLFAEFAVSLSAAVVISGITAITLTPWMSMIAIKSQKNHKVPAFISWIEAKFFTTKQKLNNLPGWVFGGAFLICIIGSYVLLGAIPNAIGPKEDRALVGLWVPGSPGSSMDDREKMAVDLDKRAQKLEGVKERISFIGNWGCSVCCILTAPGSRLPSEKLFTKLQDDVDTNVPFTCYAWSSSTGIPGMDDFGQNEMKLGISSLSDLEILYESAEKVIHDIRQTKKFSGVHLDKTQRITALKCSLHPYLIQKFNLRQDEILSNIEIFLSGKKHLQFIKDNQTYCVDLHTKVQDQDINRVFVTNPEGEVYCLGSLGAIAQEQIIEPILHLNQKRVMAIKMAAMPDTNIAASKREVAMRLKETLKNQESFFWLDGDVVGANNQKRMMLLFITALIFIYAILCIQFESFSDPLLILLTVPFAIFGGLLWIWVSGQTLNIFSQIGLITLIGLITKHGILLVEFANRAKDSQKNWRGAFEESVEKRFRPILMTTVAMVLGCLPLIVSSGPGAEIRQSLAGVLLGGLCFSTLGTLFLFPRLAGAAKSKMALMKSR